MGMLIRVRFEIREDDGDNIFEDRHFVNKARHAA